MRYLQFVALNQKEKLRGYLNDYLTELSAVDPDIKFDENGVPIYRWFDHYFTDKDIEKKFNENGLAFSSANSINWGRLVTQIVYYVSAYCDMLENGELKNGEAMNVVVPTGNFGNILAAYYAKEMGVPIKTLMASSHIQVFLIISCWFGLCKPAYSPLDCKNY